MIYNRLHKTQPPLKDGRVEGFSDTCWTRFDNILKVKGC